jgi:transcriptional regulator with XRE-family HTH domain
MKYPEYQQEKFFRVEERSADYDKFPEFQKIFEVIWERCMRKGIRQSELAPMIDITESYITKWKKGSEKVSRKHAVALLNVAADLKLFKGDPDTLWSLLSMVELDNDDRIAIFADAFDTKGHNKTYPPLRLPEIYIEGEITKQLIPLFQGSLFQNREMQKIVVLYGASNSGKTTLLKKISIDIAPKRKDGVYWISGHFLSLEDVLRQLVEMCPELKVENRDNYDYLLKKWTNWCTDPKRDVLIVLDNVNFEVLETLLPIGGQYVQYAITSSDIERDLPKLEHLTEGKVTASKIPMLTIRESLTVFYPQLRDFVSDDKSDILKFMFGLEQTDYPNVKVSELVTALEVFSGIPEAVVVLEKLLRSDSAIEFSLAANPILFPSLGVLIKKILSAYDSNDVYDALSFSDHFVEDEWRTASYISQHYESPYGEIERALNRLCNLGLFEKRKTTKNEYRPLRFLVEICALATHQDVSPHYFYDNFFCR